MMGYLKIYLGAGRKKQATVINSKAAVALLLVSMGGCLVIAVVLTTFMWLSVFWHDYRMAFFYAFIHHSHSTALSDGADLWNCLCSTGEHDGLADSARSAPTCQVMYKMPCALRGSLKDFGKTFHFLQHHLDNESSEKTWGGGQRGVTDLGRPQLLSPRHAHLLCFANDSLNALRRGWEFCGWPKKSSWRKQEEIGVCWPALPDKMAFSLMTEGHYKDKVEKPASQYVKRTFTEGQHLWELSARKHIRKPELPGEISRRSEEQGWDFQGPEMKNTQEGWYIMSRSTRKVPLGSDSHWGNLVESEEPMQAI